MEKTILYILGITLIMSSANAFECKANLDNKELKLNYSQLHQQVTIEYDHKQIAKISTSENHDGYSIYSLITGDNIAITYSHQYGCIRMVELTSAIRLQGAPYKIGKISFGTCAGGSTPDRLCKPDHFNN